MAKKQTAITKPTDTDLKQAQIESDMKPFVQDFEQEISRLVPMVGTIKLTKAQKEILYAPVNENDVEIRTDGLIYLPWMEYVTRLKEAFGMSWSIIPKGDPRIGQSGRSILWGFYLIVEGKLAGFAYGEQEYYPSNLKMNWSDACEAAKSNALMRLCKGLGMCLELWKPQFIKKWKSKFAETYEYKGKKLWKRKDKPVEQAIEAEVVEGSNEIAPGPPEETKPTVTKGAPTAQPEPKPAIMLAAEDKEFHIERIIKHGEIAYKGFGKKGDKEYPRFKEFLLDMGEAKNRSFVALNEHEKLSLHCGNLEDLKLITLHLGFVFKAYAEWKKEQDEKEEEIPENPPF